MNLFFKIFFFLPLVFVNSNVLAQWPALSTPNVQVTSSATTGGNLKDYWACSDGVGGSYSIFTDDRQDPGGNESVYCQRIDRWGNIKFTANGVDIATIATADQDRPKVTSDGFNNAIACWQDSRSGGDDIYAQKIDSNGAVKWTVNGKLICNAAGTQDKVWMVNDGSGGAIIAWEDSRSGTEDIYAQRINSAGVVQWVANGVALCTSPDTQQIPVIASDSKGGAVVAWEDKRTGVEDIYAQRINSAGVTQWTANGNIVCSAANRQQNPDISEANNGKILIVWEDRRTGTEDIYLQVIDSAGVMLGAANGIAASTAADKQTNPFVFKSGSTDWITIWQDDRNKTVTGNSDLYAQGLNPTIVPILPIKLVTFEANVNEDHVALKWITESEINNDYFTIEKSKDARNWENVLIVNGAGNSNQVMEYYDIDNQPLNGISYYRLKQTDFNGVFTYSNIVPVKYEKKLNLEMSLFPNPVERGHELKIQFSEIANTEVLIVIRDTKGQEYYSKAVLHNEDGVIVAIPMDKEIPAGLYLVTASSENQMYSKKLIVR